MVSAPPLTDIADENEVSGFFAVNTMKLSELPADASTIWVSLPSLAALMA